MTPIIRHLFNDAGNSSDNTTHRVELPKEGALHALFLKFRMTNGATAGRGVSMFDVIDQIRVLGETSTYAINITPRELEKWWETEMGYAWHNVWTEAAGAVQELVVPIYFGRKQYDRDIWFPLSKFSYPLIEVDYSPPISATVGFATGTFTCDVAAMISPASEVNAYQGTLTKRTVKAFTSLASGDDPTTLSLKGKLRALGIYAYENNTEDGLNITRVVLRRKSGGAPLYEGDWDNLLQYNQARFDPHIRHSARLLAQDNGVLDTRIGNLKGWNISPFFTVDKTADTEPVYLIDTISGDRVTLDGTLQTAAAGGALEAADTTDRALYTDFWADTPSFFGLIPFFHSDTPDEYIAPDDTKDWELVLTQGNAGADTRISVNELVKW